MSTENLVEPFCGAFVLVRASTYGGELQSASKCANNHNLAEKLLKHPNVIFAHTLLGAESLMAMIVAESPAELTKVLNEQILIHQRDRHDYITTTKQYVILSAFGLPLQRKNFNSEALVPAWIFLDISLSETEENLLRLKDRHPEILFIANTLGAHGAIMFVECSSNKTLGKLADELRESRFIFDTMSLGADI